MDPSVKRDSRLFGILLYVFAFWTLLIKYVLPIGWALSQKEPLTQYVLFWDAWWIAHLVVGYGLVRLIPKIWIGALLLCVAEIGIITVKFIFYLSNPELDFWHVNWFVNKCFLLVYFWFLLIWLFQKKVRTVYERTS